MDTLTAVSDDEYCQQADRLAGEFSSALTWVTDDDITAAIEKMQRRIGEALEVDRSTLIEFSDGAVRETYHWANDDLPPVDVHAHAARLTGLLDRISTEGEAVVLERIPDELPVEAVTPGLIDFIALFLLTKSTPMNSPVQPRQLVRTSSVKGSSPNSPARVWSKGWSHFS